MSLTFKKNSWADLLWRQKGFWTLFFASVVILFFFLGTKNIWTQEHRWADITSAMLLRHDYFHPYLDGANYYDKPLLSYWLMIAASWLTQGLNVWALRLPSALAGLITVCCTYQLGKRLVNKSTGLIAGWLLITSYFFVFWSRTASSDMLNVAGIMLAITCYYQYHAAPRFIHYLAFFITLALAALCKGLIAPCIVILVLLPDLFKNNNWLKHVNLSFFSAAVLGLIIYLIPFLISAHSNTAAAYQENGLNEVFQENVVRYFHAFDHQGPIYTYLIYLPLYIFPWIIFFIPALINLPKRWKTLLPGARWFAWACLLIFIFLTGSGSRRDYYILPILPFVALMTAEWIQQGMQEVKQRYLWAGRLAVIFYSIIFLLYAVIYPLTYAGGGLTIFSKQVQEQAQTIQPWKNWQVSILGAETQTAFYLQSAKEVVFTRIPTECSAQANQQVANDPNLQSAPTNNIFIVRNCAVPLLRPYLANYKVVYMQPDWSDRLLHHSDQDDPVALIANKVN